MAGGSYNIGAGAGGPAVMVRVKNVGTLVQQQGGRAGGLAYSLAPGTITSKVYDELRTKLAEGFQQQGVDADVQVVSTPNVGPPQPSDLVRGLVLGALAVGVGVAVWKFSGKSRK